MVNWMIVGLSTGCFYTWGLDIYQEIKKVLSSEYNAIQIAFPFKKDILVFKPFEIKNMELVVVHLPWKDVAYDDNKETKKILEKMKEIKKMIEIKYFIIHPNNVENFDVFKDFNVLVENLGSIRKFGSRLEDLKEIKKKFNPNFLLDLTHVYKIDKNMKELDDIIKLFGNNLKMLHVSGFKNGNEHSMLYDADNRDLIIKYIKKLKQYPIILEGQIPSNNLINKDLELIKNI